MNILIDNDNKMNLKEVHKISVYLFIFAMAVRGIYYIGFMDNPFFDYVSPDFDEINFDKGAIEFSNGNIMAQVGSEGHAPLYTYFLGIIYWLVGHKYYAVWAVQFTIGALSSVLMFLITLRFFNKWVGIICAVFYAMYGPNIYYEGDLLREFLAEFLAIVLFYYLLRYNEETRLKYSILSAAFFSLLIQCRPNAIFLLPFCVYFVYAVILKASSVRVKTRHLLVFFGLLIVVGTPLMVRTIVVHKKFVLYDTSGPQTLLIGNVPEYEGVGWNDLEFIEMTKNAVDDPDNYAEVFSYMLKRFCSSPVDFLMLYARKIYWFFNNYEYPSNTNYYLYQEFSPVLKNPLGSFSLLASLAFVGIFLTRKDYKRHLLIYFFLTGLILSVVIFYPTSRFRITAVPFFMIFASYTFYHIFQKIYKKEVILPLFYVMFTALTTYLLKTPEAYSYKVRPIDFGNLAAAYFSNENKYNPKKTEEYFIKSWNQNSKINSKKMAINSKTRIEGEKKEVVLFKNPASDNLSRLYTYLLSRSFADRNYKDAAIYAKKVLELDYTDIKTHQLLNYCYLEEKDYENAMVESKVCAMMESQEAKNYYNLLALFYDYLQDYLKAITYYQKAIDIEPDIVKASSTDGDKLEKSLKDIAFQIQQTIELNYNKIDTLWNTTLKALETGQFETAISDCKEILAIDYGNINAHSGLAYSYGRLELYEDSISEYINILTLDPYLDEIHYNLYELYSKFKKDNIKAMYHLEQSLKIDPQQEGHNDLNEKLRELKSWSVNLRQISFDY